MITADQLLCHAIGDYLIQSDWMANNKTKSSFAAAIHAITYAIPFMALRPSWFALFVIIGTHFGIDRWRLARYVVWFKNSLGGSYFPWVDCSATGYHKDRPVWLSVWLLIIADNILHVLINGLALRFS